MFPSHQSIARGPLLSLYLLMSLFFISASVSQSVESTANSPVPLAPRTSSLATSTIGCAAACSTFSTLSTPSSIVWCNCRSYLFKNYIATCSSCNAVANPSFASLLGNLSAGCEELGYTVMTIPVKQSASGFTCTIQPAKITIGTSVD